jgi:hypothetical protein
VNPLALLGCSILLASSWKNYSIDRKPISDTAVFPSPDGRRVASFQQEDNGWYHLKVKDVATGHVDDSAEAQLTPIFSVLWTHDSKSILTIAHVAHGSSATFFHLKDGKWVDQNITFPDIPGVNGPNVYRVVEEVAKAEANNDHFVVYYEFGVQTKAADGSLQETIYDEIDRVDPETGKSVLVKRTHR